MDPIILEGSLEQVRDYLTQKLPKTENLVERDNYGHFVSEILMELKIKIARERVLNVGPLERRLQEIKIILNELTRAREHSWRDALLGNSSRRILWKNPSELAHMVTSPTQASIAPISSSINFNYKGHKLQLYRA